MQPTIEINSLNKGFVLHNQGQTRINVLQDISLKVFSGECVVLQGNSGRGKSTLLRCLYSNYLSQADSILLRINNQSIDLSTASERALIQIRKQKIAYVSQFLRVIPRIPALQIVMQPLLDSGCSEKSAEKRAQNLLSRLNIPKRLWQLSPTTFSGGEQQRVNIAREFSQIRPLMLLDEPTASLDSSNRETVIELILEACQQGAAMLGIFHDAYSREKVASRIFDLKTGKFDD